MSDYGDYILIMAIVSTAVAISALGIPQSIIFYIGKRENNSADLLKNIYILWIAIAGLVCFALYIFRDWLFNSILEDVSIEYLKFILILFLVKLIEYYLISFARGHKKFILYNFKRLIDPFLILVIVLGISLFSNFSLLNLIYIFVIVSILTTTLLLLYLQIHYLKQFSIGKFKLSTIKGMLSFGSKSYIQMLIAQFNYQISVYMLAYFMKDSDVALYSISISIATILWFVPNTVGVVLLPTLTSMDSVDKIHQATIAISRNTAFITILGLVFLVGFGKVMIHLFYGDQYIYSYMPMLIMLPGVFFMSLYKILTRNFTSRNKQQISIGAGVSALIINLILNWLLIPIFGINGAALSTSISFIIAGIFLIIFFSKDSNLPITQLLFINKNDINIYTENTKKLYLKFNQKILRK